MVLYTPLLHEEIFPETEAKVKVVTHLGKQLHVRETPSGELELVQLLSTNPQDFLQTCFSPGRIINR